MIITTGMKPKVAHHRIPRMGQVAYQIEDTSYAEPLGNLHILDVWTIHWFTEDGTRPTDFMLFTTEPEVEECTFTYKEDANLTEASRRMEQYYREQRNVPADAVVEREEVSWANMVRVTLKWNVVTVP